MYLYIKIRVVAHFIRLVLISCPYLGIMKKYIEFLEYSVKMKKI